MVTVTLAFSLIFAFNFIAFSNDLTELSEYMDNFKYAVLFVSCIVIFVIGWLINYTMRFMFEKRSKEFGTYMLLGIKKKKINKLFLLENIILGAIAAFFSFFIGIGISLILSAIIMNIFEMPYQIVFAINKKSVCFSLLYFIFIYLFVLLRSRRRIKKMKIYDLLYFEKRNEKEKNTKTSNTTFLFSCLLGVIGLYLFDYAFSIIESPTMMLPFFISIIMIGISVYGVTMSLGEFILNFVLKRPKIKYHNDNLFITRNFSSKIRTMSITIGTLALLATLTLVSLNVSFLFKDAFENNVNRMIPYDIIIDKIYSETGAFTEGESMDYREKYQEYHTYIEKTLGIKEELLYNIYKENKNSLEEDQIMSKIKKVSGGMSFGSDTFIKLSDYNKLLKMLNREEIHLKEDEYRIHYHKELKEWFEKLASENPTIILKGKTLKAEEITYQDYVTGWNSASYYFIVVPDEYVENMLIDNTQNAINTIEETTTSFANRIKEEIEQIEISSEYNDEPFTIIVEAMKIRGEYLAQNRSAMTMFSFSLIYLSFVFVAVVGTILSIQTLSDSTKYKYRYNLLKKLGVKEVNRNKTILKQVTLNFVFPIIYPIIIAVITTISLNKLFGMVTSEDYTYLYTLGNTCLLFFSIYFLYFLSTYFSFKKNIDE